MDQLQRLDFIRRDGEETVQPQKMKDLDQVRGNMAKNELPADFPQPAVQEDQLPQHSAGQPLNGRKVDDQAAMPSLCDQAQKLVSETLDRLAAENLSAGEMYHRCLTDFL
jgi:hypothetical protein